MYFLAKIFRSRSLPFICDVRTRPYNRMFACIHFDSPPAQQIMQDKGNVQRSLSLSPLLRVRQQLLIFSISSYTCSGFDNVSRLEAKTSFISWTLTFSDTPTTNLVNDCYFPDTCVWNCCIFVFFVWYVIPSVILVALWILTASCWNSSQMHFYRNHRHQPNDMGLKWTKPQESIFFTYTLYICNRLTRS